MHDRLRRIRAASFYALIVVSMLSWVGSAHADDAHCRRVRFADTGWTDLAVTTAVASALATGLGYSPELDELSLPVALLSLSHGDVDVFLGNWMPSQRPDVAPYLANKSLTVLGANLTGARFGLAVPQYVYDSGVHTLADLPAAAKHFDAKIYGVEPGNDGNDRILRLIRGNVYGLSPFTLVESSEQAMLTEVRQRLRTRDSVVFLAWQPHPMNRQIVLQYLDDPERAWDDAGGAAEVQTLVRKDLPARCPNLARLLRNLVFSVDMENELMERILVGGVSPAQAADDYLRSHPEQKQAWLAGVTALPSLAHAASTVAPPAWKLPLGAWLERAALYIAEHGATRLRLGADRVADSLELVVSAVAAVPAQVIMVVWAALVGWTRRRIVLGVGTLIGLAAIWSMGYWHAMLETLALVLTATLFAVGLGVPLGIMGAHRAWVYRVLEPFLDLMQTIPTFVYLIPALMLFGLGIVPGLVATVVFILPASIRLTHLGMQTVPPELLEASHAFGASSWQRLCKVELPCARAAILAGISQTLMLGLSMVVVAALVGAGGLGAPVVRALNTVNIAQGFEAGISIVILAIILDRMCRRREPMRQEL